MMKDFDQVSRSTRYRILKKCQEATSSSDESSFTDNDDEGSSDSVMSENRNSIVSEVQSFTCSENEYSPDSECDFAVSAEDNQSLTDDNDNEDSCDSEDHFFNCQNNCDTEGSSSDSSCSQNNYDGWSENDVSEWNDSSEDSVDEESESSDNSSDDDEPGPFLDNDHLNDPLYENAPLTLGESLLCILTFMIRHKTPKVMLADLLSLIYVHCRKPNFCIKTLYFFQKFFKNLRTPIKRHFFCCDTIYL
ncbi:hypothetical protein KQX54_007009 [Cotesia glomerata]|uniref:Uncharacterized protein n=1 Tax=Cotesia glomerata TaxID=32391 RepID=A0AAV7HXC4_COTGL|nr:hypothetical protein KQX54_007009 [Cotesia glomerata]